MRMLCTANNRAGEYVDNNGVKMCMWTEDCVDEIMVILNSPFLAILQTCPKSVICWNVHKVVWMRMAWVNCCNSNLSLCLALHVSFLQTKYKMHCQPMQHFVTQTFNRCSSCVPISSDGGFHLYTQCWGSIPRRPHRIAEKPALERGAGEKQPPADGPLRRVCRHCQQDKPVKRQGKRLLCERQLWVPTNNKPMSDKQILEKLNWTKGEMFDLTSYYSSSSFLLFRLTPNKF